MPNSYQKLESRFQRLAQIDHALTFLQWDQLVMMPPGGNEARARSMAELTALRHELLTAADVGDLIPDAGEKETDPERKRSVVEMERVWRQAVCLPADLVRAKSLAGTRCEHGWRTQRQQNDWPGFLENFREVVRLSREEAQARQAAAPDRLGSPYDALLDLYCTGEDARSIRKVFTDLKQALPEVMEAVREHQPAQFPVLEGRYPVEDQAALNRRLMADLGFDFNAGRLDVSMHPFSTGGPGDHRITTRFRETDFFDALMATAHETGHASYESGLPKRWEGLPVGQARSMSIHESQSLLFEKHLFLSRPFIDHFTGAVHEHLPASRGFGGEQIWLAGIRVQPGLIRIEADEVSYPLHVILRFEIESDLIDGALEPEDIPEVWDGKMQAYLGLQTRGNDRDGCLQDIHWTDGAFGYFPSYTMGALNAAQLSAAVREAHPDWQDRLAGGDAFFFREWLKAHVWDKGCLLDSREILVSATGEETNPRYFLDHLRARYLEHRY